MSKQEKEMSFLDHLEVLRWTLVRSSLYIVGFGIIAFIFKDFIFNNIILKPKDPSFITYRVLCSLSQKFGTNGLCIDEIPFIVQSRTMAGQFSAHIWTAITTGFIVAFPFVMREFWKFIEPGLYATEKKNARLFIFVSSFLFFIGILFGYYVIAPVSVNFLGSYRVAEEVKNNIDLSSYIGLIKASSLASGFIFELPIVVYFLTKMGLVTPELMIQYRKYALVLVLVLAAIITPPDVVSQIIVAIPMVILYEISIRISKYIVKKQKKKEAEENTDVSVKK
jgi:sec-independent protein translocase protein TatC